MTRSRRMDLSVIARAGERRLRAHQTAQLALDTIADECIAAGDLANVKLAAQLSGVSRGALIKRIQVRREATT